MEFRYQVRVGNHGFPYVEDDPGAYLRVDHAEGDDGVFQVHLTGNRAGLLLLAKYLISLAEHQPQTGYHFHLDPARPLEPDSDSMVLYKRDRPEKTPT